MPSSASRRKLADQQDSSDEDTDASSTSAHSDSDQSDSGAGRGDKKKAGGRDSKNVDSGREESDDEDGDDTEDEEKAVGGRGRAGSKLYEAGKGARGGDAKSQAVSPLIFQGLIEDKFELWEKVGADDASELIPVRKASDSRSVVLRRRRQ